MEYIINNRKIEYSAEGEKSFGNDEVLLNRAIDLTKGLDWNEAGYCVEKIFFNHTLEKLKHNTHQLLVESWKEVGLEVPDHFSLENYHTLINDFETHLKVLEKIKLLSTTSFPVDISIVEKTISKILKQEVHACNPFDNQRVFHFRIIRPLSGDNNPLHRDVWLEDYDNCINLYIPIAGSDENSSLILAPNSHLWPESIIERTIAGARIDGKQYNVPAVTRLKCRAKFIRPNPTVNEAIIFSPYLIHGGAANLNSDTTRISIELRLWKKNYLYLV